MKDSALLQVAFAGHNRPEDLGDHPPVIADLDSAFALLKRAGVRRARLLTGLADGADELAAAAWARSGLGPAHAIFPFLHETTVPPVGEGGLAQSATWLDGDAALTRGRNPHLQQTRLLIGASDMLVIVWTGDHARGAGGTADAVRMALDLGMPVLWVMPGAPGQLRLLRSDNLASDFDFAEFQEGLHAGEGSHFQPATPEVLRDLLGLKPSNPQAAEAEESPEPTPVERWMDRTVWRTYATFRRLMGGRGGGPGPKEPELPADLAAQPGFAALTAAYVKADRSANRLSAIHRSEQILLLLAMVTAAIVGSAPSVWPAFKWPATLVELALGLAALAVWASAQRARQHERWGQDRLLAEQLRVDRAGWALAVPPLRGSRVESDDGELARDFLREAGLPHGRFDAERVNRWGAWAMSELVSGQAAYHRNISRREGRIAHRIHALEDVAFVVLLGALALYQAVHLIEHWHHMAPEWFSGVVTMLSTIVPAIGAAGMALEAKLAFHEQSERSLHIAARLERLEAQLGPNPSHDQLQEAARSAMRWLVAEASHWRDGVGRRKLFRP